MKQYTFTLSSIKPYYIFGILFFIISFFYFRYLVSLEWEYTESDIWLSVIFYLAFLWALKGIFRCRSVEYNEQFLLTKSLWGKKEEIPLESMIYFKKTTFRIKASSFEYKIRYKINENDTDFFYTMVGPSDSFDSLIYFLRSRNPTLANKIEEDMEVPFT